MKFGKMSGRKLKEFVKKIGKFNEKGWTSWDFFILKRKCFVKKRRKKYCEEIFFCSYDEVKLIIMKIFSIVLVCTARGLGFECCIWDLI